MGATASAKKKKAADKSAIRPAVKPVDKLAKQSSIRTAGKSAQKPTEKIVRSFPVQYLEDLIFEFMLNTGLAAKSREIASELEETVKLHPKFIRKVLSQSERFGMEDRRWNLALRIATQLPFEGAIEYALRSYGKPMTLRALQTEMAVVQRRSVGFFDDLLIQTLQSRSKYLLLPDETWCLREWILDTSENDPERCFLRNFFLTGSVVRPTLDLLLDTRMTTEQPSLEMAIKLIRRTGEPLPNKLLNYAIWRLREGDFDPIEFLQECRQEPRLLQLSGPMWVLQEFVERYYSELVRLSRRAEKEEDAEWAEEEEPEGPIIITPSDMEEVHKYLTRRKQPLPARSLVEAILEYSPGLRRFDESVDALSSAMSLDGRFVRVGRQTWALPGMMPKGMDKVPASLLPVPIQPREDEADAELDDEGLEPVLVSWVHDPRYEDFGEESEIEIGPEQQPTDELRYVLLYDHWQAGTLKVRVCDRRFYPSESDLLCATFIDKETKKSYAVWLSYSTSLLYGLNEWYEARNLRPGSIFTVTPGSVADEFMVSYKDEMDPLVAISDERLQELTKLRKQMDKEGWSVFDLMQRSLSFYKKGAPFMTVWAEVNVLRRTRRRVAASNLASYHCFFQRPANSDNWIFDERKITQGRKKTKKKFLRA